MRALYMALVVLLLALPACGSKLDPGQSAEENQTTAAQTDTPAEPNSTTVNPGSTTTSACDPNLAGATYTKQAAAVVNARCAPCHRPSGTQPRPDLSTYAGAKGGFMDGGLQLLDSGAMPPSSAKSGQVTKQEKCLLDAWAAAGYLQ